MYVSYNMARFSLLIPFLLVAFLLTSESRLLQGNAVPQNHRAAGVFMLIEGKRYTMNFAAATAACLFLNVTIATKAQIERALQQGLETCKFGWIQERFAVVPRLKSDKNCGQGKTGVVPWFASTDKEFGVFCFNASDLETPSTARPQMTTSSTTLTQPGTPALLTSTPRPPPSGEALTSFTSAFTLPITTTHTERISSTSSFLKPFSTHLPTSLSHIITSKPTVSSFNISALADYVSVTSESAPPLSVSSDKPSLGVIPTTVIIVGIILLLLAAGGAVWCYKLNLFTLWKQKDDVETEMWKRIDSEMDLHSQRGGEEDEESNMYSSEIMLCVSPDVKTNSSE